MQQDYGSVLKRGGRYGTGLWKCTEDRKKIRNKTKEVYVLEGGRKYAERTFRPYCGSVLKRGGKYATGLRKYSTGGRRKICRQDIQTILWKCTEERRKICNRTKEV